MFFILSKIFWLVASPLSLIWLLFTIALCIRPWFREASNRLFLVTGIIFITLGTLPIGYNLVVMIERQYQRPQIMPAHIDGIIVLGGAFNSVLAEKTGMISANGNINRMIDFADLARQYPQAKLVFSGGSGNIMNPNRKEADDAEAFIKMIGMDSSRIIFERNSRNTYENALFSKRLAEPKEGEVWLLVTSSFHMPRSMGVFRQLDWDVIAYPSGPKTDLTYIFWPTPFEIANSYFMLGKAIKELIGSFAYYFSGKSAFLLPLNSVE